MRAILGLLLIFVAGPAMAHSAPSGWVYPTDCCDPEGLECHPEPLEIVEGGVYIPRLDITLLANDKRIRASGDGETHMCNTNSAVWCVFLPIAF